jgi:hypothetical protein
MLTEDFPFFLVLAAFSCQLQSLVPLLFSLNPSPNALFLSSLKCNKIIKRAGDRSSERDREKRGEIQFLNL